MNRLYGKSEIWFSMVWIILYCVLASIGDAASSVIGVAKIATFPILLALSIAIYSFVKRHDLKGRYGLKKPEIKASKMLFYLPLAALTLVNLWAGFAISYTSLEAVLYVLSMLCVGFIEEMIFRGFLFEAIALDGIKPAIVISSITFGLGHIINLLTNTYVKLIPNLLQVTYAIAIGFVFVIVYYKTKSIWPCIITHGVFNSLSVFGGDIVIPPVRRLLDCMYLVAIAIGYVWYICRVTREKIDIEE